MVSKGETLLSASAVKLYGRVVAGLEIKLDQARAELGANRFLRQQLDPTANSAASPKLASWTFGVSTVEFMCVPRDGFPPRGDVSHTV